MTDNTNLLEIDTNDEINPFTYGLNYSLVGSYDYSEDIEDIDSTIEKNPLVSSILHQLKSRYKKLIKKERMDDIIKDDFFDFLNKEDELLKCLNDIVYTVDTNSFFEEFDDLHSVVNDILGGDEGLREHLNILESKEKNKVLEKCINKISDDCEVNFDKLAIDIAKLKLYQNQLSRDYLVFRGEIRHKLKIIGKKIKGLTAIENIFDFDQEDSEVLKNLIEKYIEKEDVFNLIKTYIPIKIKLFLLISISNNYKNDYDCRVCLLPQTDLYAITKCGHVFCKNCIEMMDRCPLCRLPIDKTIRLFL